MAAVELDRQAIERRDFPIGRRGYDTAAVDAHLRAVAAEVEELRRAAAGGGAETSLAAAAGNQVQSILAAAESAAAEIERQASEEAQRTREAAQHDAARTREDAIARAQAHVAAVSQVAAALLERVGSMDSEAGALVESLRTGAGRLASDLASVERSMAELYDAAAGRVANGASGGAPARSQATAPSHAPEASHAPAFPEAPFPETPAPSAPSGGGRSAFEAQLDEAMARAAAAAPEPAPTTTSGSPAATPPPSSPSPASEPAAGSGGDIDGARLIALNMALNGESREETERYLAENFELPDRGALVDEVYAAIEG
jgi:DivIVA domain-containing protein